MPKPIMINENPVTRPEVLTRQGIERRGLGGDTHVTVKVYLDRYEIEPAIVRIIKETAKDGILQVHPLAIEEY